MGQVSGILFALGMDTLKSPRTGSMTVSLLVLAGLMAVTLVLSTRLQESALLQREGQ